MRIYYYVYNTNLNSKISNSKPKYSIVPNTAQKIRTIKNRPIEQQPLPNRIGRAKDSAREEDKCTCTHIAIYTWNIKANARARRSEEKGPACRRANCQLHGSGANARLTFFASPLVRTSCCFFSRALSCRVQIPSRDGYGIEREEGKEEEERGDGRIGGAMIGGAVLVCFCKWSGKNIHEFLLGNF